MSSNNHPNPINILGMSFIGVILATFLQGMLTLQVYYFYEHCHRDSRWLKILVGTLWALDMIHLALVVGGVYHNNVTNWGNYATLAVSPWQLNAHVAVECLATFLCQAGFLNRVHLLSNKNYFLTAWPFLAALASCILSVIVTVEIFQNPLYIDAGRMASKNVAIFSLTVAVDCVIAFSLCYYLGREKIYVKETQTMVRKVIKYTISTGLLTSIVAIISLITLKIQSPVFFITVFSMGGLYTNSLLASLNMRQSLRNGSDGSRSVRLSNLDTQRQTMPESLRIVVSSVTVDDYCSIPTTK